MTIAKSRGMWGITVDTLALDILMLMLMLMYTGVNQGNQARSYLDFDYSQMPHLQGWLIQPQVSMPACFHRLRITSKDHIQGSFG